jgi:hypothetical protein
METRREHLDWLWRRGSNDAVAAALDRIEDPKERGEIYVRAFAVAQRWRTVTARFIGGRYVDEFYREPEPFGAGVRPDAALLWDLADLFEREKKDELAEWVCEFALAFGMSTDRDFEGRMASLREARGLQRV